MKPAQGAVAARLLKSGDEDRDLLPLRVRKQTRQSPQPSLVAYARHLDQEIAETEDGAEGSRVFREKRRPVWKVR